MPRKKTHHKTMTEALRHEILTSGLSCQRLERETGVRRQSLMLFARGEGSFRLESADKLAVFFGLQVVKRKAK